jgi:hypothetical protein
MTQKTEMAPQNVGVINPFALAEAILDKPIAWDEADAHEVLSDTLGMSYDQLFDPANNSPLYSGLHLDPETLELNKVEPTEIDVGTAGIYESSELVTDADEFATDADQALENGNLPDILAGLATAAAWQDKGVFFKEAAEFFDPIQGAVGDCYLIAALSSVAWARTYEISHRSRATGSSQQSFVDMITFHQGNQKVQVEVTEKVPVSASGNPLYARSSEAGEVWPAILEKAYAKWRTNHSGDTPNILSIAGGDPVRAAAQITGLSPSYYWTASSSPDTIYKRVRENSLSYKTFNPMVAWTYSSGDKSPDKIKYSDANLVANHAYSILGWSYRNSNRYIILRNPWGQKEASTDYLPGSWMAWDTPYYGGPGWWRTISLGANDGIFGLRVETFKKYFAGFGVVK